MKIGIIVGSIREGRVGTTVGQWVMDHLSQRSDAQFELVDLASFNVPLLTSPVPPAMLNGQYPVAEVQAWADKIGEFDGYIFVTPEYNHGVPGAFKNAVDSIGVEWMRKAVAFVAYGADGGLRAVEQWRQILANFEMYDVRQAVLLNRFVEFDQEGNFQPNERRDGELALLGDQLIALVAQVRS